MLMYEFGIVNKDHSLHLSVTLFCFVIIWCFYGALLTWTRNKKTSEKTWTSSIEDFEEETIRLFVAASHQTRLDTRSKARRPIKVGMKGRGRSGTSRDSNPAGLCCSSVHLVQCEPDEASSFTNPNVGPGTYASLRLKLDARSSAIRRLQKRQKCSSPTRRKPSRN